MNKNKIQVGDLVLWKNSHTQRTFSKKYGVGLVVGVVTDSSAGLINNYVRYRIYWFKASQLTSFNYTHQLTKLSPTQEKENE